MGTKMVIIRDGIIRPLTLPVVTPEFFSDFQHDSDLGMWTGNVGDVTIVGGVFRIIGTVDSIVYMDTRGWDSFIYDFDYVIIAGGFVEPFVRVQDVNNGYLVDIDQAGSIIHFYRKVGGGFTLIVSIAFALPVAGHVTIKGLGFNFYIWIDGVYVGVFNDPASTFPYGSVGFRTSNARNVDIDNASLRSP